MMIPNIICLDFETGGLTPKNNPITEIGLIGVNPVTGEEITRYSTYVKPYANLIIEKKALEASAVKMSDIQKGLELSDAFKEFIKHIKLTNKSGRERTKPVLLGHNIVFDISFLKMACFHLKIDVCDLFQNNNGELVYYDTMRMSMLRWDKFEEGENSKYTLTACCERAGVKLTNAHSALFDVEATLELFKYLKNNNVEFKKEENGERKSTEKSRKFFKF